MTLSFQVDSEQRAYKVIREEDYPVIKHSIKMHITMSKE